MAPENKRTARVIAHVSFWLAVVMAVVALASAIGSTLSELRSKVPSVTVRPGGIRLWFEYWTLMHFYVGMWATFLVWVCDSIYLLSCVRGRSKQWFGWLCLAGTLSVGAYWLAWGGLTLGEGRDASGWVVMAASTVEAHTSPAGPEFAVILGCALFIAGASLAYSVLKRQLFSSN
jgi:hypothetical protein